MPLNQSEASPQIYELWRQSNPYTIILDVKELVLDVVTMNNDYYYLKVGCIVIICIPKDSLGFDLSSYPGFKHAVALTLP